MGFAFAQSTVTLVAFATWRKLFGLRKDLIFDKSIYVDFTEGNVGNWWPQIGEYSNKCKLIKVIHENYSISDAEMDTIVVEGKQTEFPKDNRRQNWKVLISTPTKHEFHYIHIYFQKYFIPGVIYLIMFILLCGGNSVHINKKAQSSHSKTIHARASGWHYNFFFKFFSPLQLILM